MRIVYVAKHDSGGNDDEGAIYHALTELGHDVQRVREHKGGSAHRMDGIDLVLFHKWDDVEAMRKYSERGIPLAFWYFDLVEWPNDPTLVGRNKTRRAWMDKVLPEVTVGFCTDGDWVMGASWCGNTLPCKLRNKLSWLTQGCDERYAIQGTPQTTCNSCGAPWQGPPILFTGISKGGGVERISFVEEMQTKWGKLFRHVDRGVHGADMANLIASAKVVIAPDSPITDRYWSNRAINVLGFGGLLVHPACSALEQCFINGEDAIYYGSREELHRIISQVLKMSEQERRKIANNGHYKALANHTYRHRCQLMISIIEGRLGWKDSTLADGAEQLGPNAK